MVDKDYIIKIRDSLAHGRLYYENLTSGKLYKFSKPNDDSEKVRIESILDLSVDGMKQIYNRLFIEFDKVHKTYQIAKQLRVQLDSFS